MTTDVTRPLGLRDRAMLETLYSTAIRCSELTGLEVYDLQPDRRILSVRQGKGRKPKLREIANVHMDEKIRRAAKKAITDIEKNATRGGD